MFHKTPEVPAVLHRTRETRKCFRIVSISNIFPDSHAYVLKFVTMLFECSAPFLSCCCSLYQGYDRCKVFSVVSNVPSRG